MYLLNIKGFDILASFENGNWFAHLDKHIFMSKDIPTLKWKIEGFMKLNKQKYFNF